MTACALARSVCVGRVLSRHGDWVVTTWGIENTHPQHCYYGIHRGRVWESYGDYGSDSWVHHMSEKRWVDVADFAAALHDAQRRWPRQRVAA